MGFFFIPHPSQAKLDFSPLHMERGVLAIGEIGVRLNKI